MSSYDGQNLFGSGPHRFTIGGRELRHETHEQPGADGQRITPLGRTARRITQQGTLIADSIGDLQSQTEAIEAAMTGQPAELIDDRGRAWPHVVMLQFKPGPTRRLGPRLAVDYTIAYSQVRP